MAIVGRLLKTAAKKGLKGRGVRTAAQKAALKKAVLASAKARAKNTVKKVATKKVAKAAAKKTVKKVSKPVVKKVSKPVVKKTAAVLKKEAEIKAIKKRIRVLKVKRAALTAVDTIQKAVRYGPAVGSAALVGIGAAQAGINELRARMDPDSQAAKEKKRKQTRRKAQDDWQTALDQLN